VTSVVDEEGKLRDELAHLTDQLMEVYHGLSKNGPSNGDPMLDRENASLRRSLVEFHRDSRALSSSLDQLRRQRRLGSGLHSS